MPEIFVEFAPAILKALQEAGFKFYILDGKSLVRLVTAFNTAPEDVEKFIKVAIDSSSHLSNSKLTNSNI